MNPSFVVYQAQPSSLDTLVLVDEIRVQAGLLSICILLREASWCARPSELANLFHVWRTASLRSFDWCAARRRWLRAAGVSGAGTRAGLLLHHSPLALKPQHSPSPITISSTQFLRRYTRVGCCASCDCAAADAEILPTSNPQGVGQWSRVAERLPLLPPPPPPSPTRAHSAGRPELETAG